MSGPYGSVASLQSEDNPKYRVVYSKSPLHRYTAIKLISLLFGVSMCMMLGFWLGFFKGGWAWMKAPELMFNWHPLLMVIALVFCNGQTMLFYRTFRKPSRRTTKAFHVIFHCITFGLMVVALVAVFYWRDHLADITKQRALDDVESNQIETSHNKIAEQLVEANKTLQGKNYNPSSEKQSTPSSSRNDSSTRQRRSNSLPNHNEHKLTAHETARQVEVVLMNGLRNKEYIFLNARNDLIDLPINDSTTAENAKIIIQSALANYSSIDISTGLTVQKLLPQNGVHSGLKTHDLNMDEPCATFECMGNALPHIIMAVIGSLKANAYRTQNDWVNEMHRVLSQDIREATSEPIWTSTLPSHVQSDVASLSQPKSLMATDNAVRIALLDGDAPNEPAWLSTLLGNVQSGVASILPSNSSKAIVDAIASVVHNVSSSCDQSIELEYFACVFNVNGYPLSATALRVFQKLSNISTDIGDVTKELDDAYDELYSASKGRKIEHLQIEMNDLHARRSAVQNELAKKALENKVSREDTAKMINLFYKLFYCNEDSNCPESDIGAEVVAVIVKVNGEVKDHRTRRHASQTTNNLNGLNGQLDSVTEAYETLAKDALAKYTIDKKNSSELYEAIQKALVDEHEALLAKNTDKEQIEQQLQQKLSKQWISLKADMAALEVQSSLAAVRASDLKKAAQETLLPDIEKHDIDDVHGLMGIVTVILFTSQFILGFLGFLFPKASVSVQRWYRGVHHFFGVTIFFLACASATAGLSLYQTTGWNTAGVLCKMFILCLIVYATTVGYLITNNAFRVGKTLEEKSLLYEHLDENNQV